MENHSLPTIEWFYIPNDILMLVTTILAIGFSCLFILIIVLDKTCRTMPMFLVGNSCLSSLMFEFIVLHMSIFALNNDLNEIFIEDTLCIIRGYFGYVFAGILYYSFFIQSVHRYLTAVYPMHSFNESYKFIFVIVIISWLLGFIYPLVLLLTHGIVYNADNQICQLPMKFSFSMIYLTLFVFSLPMIGIGIIYFLLVRYVKQMNKRMASVNALARARNQLKMIQRIIILISILLIVGIPYLLLSVMSWFMSIPKYHFRIGCLFTNISMLCVKVALLQMTDPLKECLIKKLRRNANTIVPITVRTHTR